jgi:hypothetical protein
MREIIAGAVAGSVADPPLRESPGATVSRFVPSAASWASRSARLDDEMPATLVMAAMPMAIPSADRNTRIGRVRKPTAPTAMTSRSRSRAGK